MAGLLPVRPRPRAGSRLFVDPGGARAEAHLRIGRLLAAHTPPEKREEAIFEIVNQLNRGAALITSREEREQLAELNLMAGKRAKASTAYASALNYLRRRRGAAGGRRLGAPAATGLRAGAAPGRMRVPDRRAGGRRGAVDAAVVPRRDDRRTGDRRVLAHGRCARRSVRATAPSTSCLDYLRHLGIHWSPHPTEEEARQRIRARSGRSSAAARSRSSSTCR